MQLLKGSKSRAFIMKIGVSNNDLKDVREKIEKQKEEQKI
jgi:hypothetical protein